MDTPDSAATGRVVELDGARIWYRDEGSGPVVVLVHAGIADQRMWDGLVAELGGSYRTIRFDMRGFGSTFAQAGEYSPATDIESLFQALAIDEATVVGASFGGAVSLEFAIAYPHRVTRLVLIDAGPYDDDWSAETDEFLEQEDALASEGRFDEATELNVQLWVGQATPEVQALVRVMQRRAYDLQAGSGIQAAPLVEDLDQRVGELEMPVVVAYGDRDRADFIAQAKRLAREIPNATLHAIEGAQHLPALEQPAAVAALITA